MNPSTILTVVAFVALVAGGVALVRHRDPGAGSDTAWDLAARSEDGPVGRAYLGVAGMLRGVTVVTNAASDPQLGFLATKLAQGGGIYGGSVDVFLTVQLAAIIISAVAALVLSATGTLPPVIVVAASTLMIMVPYSRLSEAVRTRSKVILDSLPLFVDLLVIPIVAGNGIRQSLEQTARRLSGPVAAEVSRAARDAATGKPLELALNDVAERLAVPEARTFFASLAQAETSGQPVLEQLVRYRDALRYALYQKKRETIRKLPVKLTIMFVPSRPREPRLVDARGPTLAKLQACCVRHLRTDKRKIHARWDLPRRT